SCIGGSESHGHFSLINEACSMFAHTNPLHLDVFKSVAHFEAEVVAMTAALLGSKEKNSGGQICGNMTPSGTEYIISYQYFNIKLWHVPINKNFQVDVKAIQCHITKNTILV
ncbi:Sphingosine-1-phosphate lyase, partial [Glycine soja]